MKTDDNAASLKRILSLKTCTGCQYCGRAQLLIRPRFPVVNVCCHPSTEGRITHWTVPDWCPIKSEGA